MRRIIITAGALALATAAQAQTTGVPANSGPATEVEAVIVTGTRAQPRTAFESSTPVDSISSAALESIVSDELMDKLAATVPSFNVQRLPAADGLAFVRPATLRGLSADQTLVLVNGKRRHRSAVLGGRGAQGVDLGQLPSLALESAEVLRDGASAQYGSDAIAGVINLILNDNPGFSAFAQLSQYSEGDGFSQEAGLRAGYRLGDAGHLVVTATVLQAEATSRTRQRPDAVAFQTANPTVIVPSPVQRWGQPDRESLRLVVNAGLPLTDRIDAYGFATYADSYGVTDFNWRNPATDTSYRNSPAFPGFNLRQVYPAGFTPRFGQDEINLSAVGGVKGEVFSDLAFDLSVGFGRDEIDYFLTETINASFGPQSPRAFRAGVLTQQETSVNLDLVKPLDLGWTAAPASLAFGAEARRERYEIEAGERLSWDVGPGAPAGLPAGSNGFPGYSPSQAGAFDQDSYAAYVELDVPVTERFDVDLAARYEDFSEFGSSTDGKIALRYETTSWLALRGSASTGFRAPTPAQLFSTRTSQGLDTTTLQLFTAGRLSPSNPVSVFFGARPLQPEESVGYSLGAALRTGFGLTGSIDLYRIDVDDRFASSPNFSVTPAIRAQLVALRVPGADQLTSVSFFTNAFDTRTDGLDVVLGWRGEAASGTLSLTGAYNYNDTTVTRFSTTTVSALARINLEDGLPQHSASLTGVYGRGPFEGQVRVRYSGEWTDAQFQNSANLIQAFGARTFVDLSLSLDISPEIRATIGAENLLDEYPDEATFQATRGLIYSRNAVYDTDGRLFYARIGVNF